MNLRRLFNKRFGHGVLSEVRRTKVNYAAHKLLMGFSITHVADNSGLNNPGELTRLFKQYLGITPK